MNDFAKIILPTIRKIIPNMIATELVGVQPMWSIPAGLILARSVTCYPDTRTFDGQEYRAVWVGVGCNIHEITSWCTDNIGDMWFISDRDIYFMDDTAYTMFVLRWV